LSVLPSHTRVKSVMSEIQWEDDVEDENRMQHAGNLMTVYIRIRVPIQRARNECAEVEY
jgi:hypothetical protein